MFFLLCFVVFLCNNSSAQYMSFYDENEDSLGESKEIPIELLRRLNSITNMSELRGNIIEDDDYDTYLLNNDYTDISVDYSEIKENRQKRKDGVLKPKPAGCLPRQQLVKLKQSHDHRLVYFPSCIMLPRCEGCCVQGQVCRPVEIKLVDYQIVHMSYKGGDKLRIQHKEIISVEKHEKCICGCQILETDCNSLQEYSAGHCKCFCANKIAPEACNNENVLKFWNATSCKCQCRQDSECSTGSEMSHQTCRCEPKSVQLLRRNSPMRKYWYKKKRGHKQKKLKSHKKTFKIMF